MPKRKEYSIPRHETLYPSSRGEVGMTHYEFSKFFGSIHHKTKYLPNGDIPLFGLQLSHLNWKMAEFIIQYSLVTLQRSSMSFCMLLWQFGRMGTRFYVIGRGMTRNLVFYQASFVLAKWQIACKPCRGALRVGESVDHLWSKIYRFWNCYIGKTPSSNLQSITKSWNNSQYSKRRKYWSSSSFL